MKHRSQQMSLPGLEGPDRPPIVPAASQAPLGRGASPYLGISVLQDGIILKASYQWESRWTVDGVSEKCDQTVNIGDYRNPRVYGDHRDHRLSVNQYDIMKYTIDTFWYKSNIELNFPYNWDNLAYFGQTYSENARGWAVRVWNPDPTRLKFDLLLNGVPTSSGLCSYYASREHARLVHDAYYLDRPYLPQMLLNHLCLRAEFEYYVDLARRME